MADGESGAPGNGGNGVRRSKGTAKKLERSLLPNFPCPLRKGRGQGVAAGMRAVPEDASVLPEEGTEQVALQAGREPEQRRTEKSCPAPRAEANAQTAAHRSGPPSIFTGAGGISRTHLNPLFDLAMCKSPCVAQAVGHKDFGHG